MVFCGRIPEEVRAYAHLLRSQMHWSLRDIAKECNISWSSVKRITTSSLLPTVNQRRTKRVQEVKCKRRPGRPQILSERTQRHLERELIKMREQFGSVHINDVMQSIGVPSSTASERTVRRFLQNKGYGFRNARRKGQLTCEDLRERVCFAKRMLKKYPPHFWTQDVAFYLDAVSFTFKTKPSDQVSGPRSKVWRKRNEGLKRSCTTKGRKEGTGGRYVRLVVAISYDKGIIACEPYESMTGEYFASFIRRNFRDMFEDAGKDSTTWVQDGDSSQNSAAARNAMKEVHCHLLSIPPRSPDINPIENIFHLVQRKLRKEALAHRIQRETLAQFEKRIIDTLFSIPVDTINKTIASTNKRLSEILKNKGCRIKY